MTDASKPGLALASRFDLAYNASHALALAALRRLGYRSENRYLVFQALAHTLSVSRATVRVLAKAHEVRNAGEYAGMLDLTERLITDLIKAATEVRDALRAVPPP